MPRPAAGAVDAKAFGDALSDAVIKKGAGPLDALSKEWGSIMKMWDKAKSDLFKGIDVGPFMAEVRSLFEIFGQGTESGKALKDGNSLTYWQQDENGRWRKKD